MLISHRILSRLVDRVIGVSVRLLMMSTASAPLLLPRRGRGRGRGRGRVVGVRVARTLHCGVGRTMSRVGRRRWCLVGPLGQTQVLELLQHRVVARSHLLGELGGKRGEVGTGVAVLKELKG